MVDEEEHACEIQTVYVIPDRMLIVFCVHGQQMPAYQGPVAKVGEKLAAVYPRSLWRTGMIGGR